MDTAAWIPFRWPVAWNETGFDVLRGSPVNCIIFEESAPAGLRDIAKQKGFAIPDNVEFAPLGDQLWKSSKPVLAISNAIWPGIRATKKKADEAAEAGPTGAPWVNANGWTLQMAKALVPRKTLWLASEPPNDQILTAESYQLAAAEAGSRGARWIIRLDEKLAAGLLKGDTDARKTWERIGTSVNLFQRHAAWSTFDAVAPLAVISDFAGDNEFLGGEILNLADRRNLLYRIVPKSTCTALPRCCMWTRRPRNPPSRKRWPRSLGTGDLWWLPRSARRRALDRWSVRCPASCSTQAEKAKSRLLMGIGKIRTRSQPRLMP